MAEAGGERFLCPAGGAVAGGRRRLKGLLLALTLVMVALAALVWWSGRAVPAAIAGAVAAVAFLALRMSGDLDPLWLEITDDELAVQTRRQRLTLPLPALAARRLRPGEIRHLERLAAAGGIVAGSGGFDSHRLGEFDLYASDLANAVLVETAEQAVVVTPDRPEEFLRRLPVAPAPDAATPPKNATIPAR